VAQQTVHVTREEESASGVSPEATLVVTPDAAAFSDFVTLRDRESGDVFSFGGGGAFLSEKTAATLELAVGDAFAIENADGDRGIVRLSGIVENYVQSYVYLTENAFAAAFGGAPAYITVLAHAFDGDAATRDATSAALLRSPNVTAVSFTTTLVETFSEMLKTIDYIVVVLIVSAGLLAFVVMYNLTNINIAERVKELATLRVLGFTRGETAAYIFRETTLLAVIGAAVGLIGGVFLHGFVVQTAEVDNMMFGRIIRPISFVLSVVITLAFSGVVNIIMSFKLRAINMAEALKAPE
jgi:putative ABC transport system permease protein